MEQYVYKFFGFILCLSGLYLLLKGRPIARRWQGIYVKGETENDVSFKIYYH